MENESWKKRRQKILNQQKSIKFYVIIIEKSAKQTEKIYN